MITLTKTAEYQDMHWSAFASIIDLNSSDRMPKVDIKSINDKIIKNIENMIKDEVQADKDGKEFKIENMTDLFGKTIIYSRFKKVD